MTVKVLVTNRAALLAKYGSLRTVDAALERLIAADVARGLRTHVIDLADAPTMKRMKGPTADVADEPANKAAIDAVATKLRPAYLVILGSDDVVPHQKLSNPLRRSDGDRNVPSDLPYACETAFSTELADFIAPTRVVSRVPDGPGARRPQLLLRFLKHAAGWQTRPATGYEPLGISAAKWDASSGLSLTHLFGSADALRLVPPTGPRWDKPTMSRRIHFINCHGAIADPQFYGQLGKEYPVALQSGWLKGRVASGTVVAAECCYGGQLYESGRGPLPICLRYLYEGAYAVFGSSNTAYGSEDNTNTDADLLTQYFIRSILKGASVGRAGLEARQAFVAAVPRPDPFNLKTLAQYLILGDASIHPVVAAAHTPKSTRTAKRVALARRVSPSVAKAMTSGVTSRRLRLRESGGSLLKFVRPAASLVPTTAARPALTAMLRELTPVAKGARVQFATYGAPRTSQTPHAVAKRLGVGKARGAKSAPRPTAPRVRYQVASFAKRQPIKGDRIVAVIGKEENGRLVSVRTVASR